MAKLPSNSSDAPDASDSSQSSVVITLVNNGSVMSVAADPPPGAAPEVAFISGVTSSNQVAATSFWTWNGDKNPATYSTTTSSAVKWGKSDARNFGRDCQLLVRCGLSLDAYGKECPDFRPRVVVGRSQHRIFARGQCGKRQFHLLSRAT